MIEKDEANRSPTDEGVHATECRGARVSELPLLKSARREALVAAGIWLTAMIYTVSCCYSYGYGRDPKTLTYVFGFPDWVFWGIVLPWGICTVVSSLFAFFFMKDEDLGRID